MATVKHGLSGTPIYKVLKSMRTKCYGRNLDNRYKGSDLWICDEWKDDPVAFVEWAYQNGYEANLQLARKDKDTGFFPGNCEFRKKSDVSKTHGLRHSRLYSIWTQMNQRCKNENLDSYGSYGGRGISVCGEWEVFEVFADWALNNGYEEQLSIDRVDVNGNYEPGNCKWSTNLEQSRNKRNSRYIKINEETRTLSEWAEISGVPYKTLQRRLNTGWKEEDLLLPKGYQFKSTRINGVEKSLSDWAKEAGLTYTTVQRRYDRGIRGIDLLKTKSAKRKEP